MLKEMGVIHFDRLTYQVPTKIGKRPLRELTGKLQQPINRKMNGWWSTTGLFDERTM